jgi:hypothetical protein
MLCHATLVRVPHLTVLPRASSVCPSMGGVAIATSQATALEALMAVASPLCAHKESLVLRTAAWSSFDL